MEHIDQLARDAEHVITNLGVDISTLGPCQIGTERYKRVSDIYEQLALARNMSGPKWDHAEARMEASRRSGEFLMQELWDLKKQLELLGEHTM